MKILIAGGAGYVGSKLVPELVERGYEVEVIDLLWFGNNLAKDVKVYKKDIFACTQEDLVGVDQVIFLSGVSNDPMAELWPSENFIQNGSAPSYLAFLAKKAGVKRFIYAGSCSCYGYTVNELYSEDRKVSPEFPYGISKYQGEQSTLQFQDKNFSVISLRKGTISGYSMRMRFDLIVNTMFKSVMLSNRVTVNNPSIWRPILDIRDAVSAYIRAVQADYSISGVFNVISGNYTVGQVGDIVRDVMSNLLGHNVKIEINNMADFRNYKVTKDKANTFLGFESRYRVEDIIKDLFLHREEFGDFSNKFYYNIEILKGIKECSQ